MRSGRVIKDTRRMCFSEANEGQKSVRGHTDAAISTNTWECEGVNRPAWLARLHDVPRLVDAQRELINVE